MKDGNKIIINNINLLINLCHVRYVWTNIGGRINETLTDVCMYILCIYVQYGWMDVVMDG